MKSKYITQCPDMDEFFADSRVADAEIFFWRNGTTVVATHHVDDVGRPVYVRVDTGDSMFHISLDPQRCIYGWCDLIKWAGGGCRPRGGAAETCGWVKRHIEAATARTSVEKAWLPGWKQAYRLWNAAFERKLAQEDWQ